MEKLNEFKMDVHLTVLRSLVRKLNEKINELEERIRVLEDGKEQQS